MPTPTGRALSIQQQYALELIASQAAYAAGEMLLRASTSVDRQEAEGLAAQYAALLSGAMIAVAATRAGYLQRFMAAEGAAELDISAQVLRPTVQDVLVGGESPLPPPRGVGAALTEPVQPVLRVPSQQGAMWAALARLEKDIAADKPDALPMAVSRLADWTESTAMAAADYVDAMVLGPNRQIAALRRVAHPRACERCFVVSGVLVFKTRPRLRHPQCRCSFEPVLLDDPEYKARLARYQRNVDFAEPGPYGRDRRSRGRRQQAAAEARQGEFVQQSWTDFLADEQARLAKLVTAIPSDQYRNWAVMTAAKTTQNVGGDFLPVITRD